MKKQLSYLLPLLLLGGGLSARAAVITVTSTNNASPGSGQLSLLQALTTARDGDEIRFNIPGPGPHYIATPPNGYPFITNNVTINGYSQPGSSPNTNPILAPNIAKLDIVLDSRAGGNTSMVIPQLSPTDDPGYDQSQGAVLAFLDATNVDVQGLSFLGVPQTGANQDVFLYFVSFARGASGHIGGCWLGVDPDGQTVAGAADGVTGFQYQNQDALGNGTNILVNNVVIGVTPQSTNPVVQFNVFAGMPVSPINLEGNNTRISGNFIAVLPDGLHDVDVALDPNLTGQFQGAIGIGRAGNNTLIGTDGDGLNDDSERNVFGGMLPTAMGGYDHLIEFYSQNPGTNIVIAGNYFGMGIDGKTRFTNGIPILNASGPGAQYRIGSNFDNLSDPSEGNLIANNYPSELFPASGYLAAGDAISFLSQLTTSGAVSLRGNSLIDNFPFPVSPLRNGGSFFTDYYAQALVDSTKGVSPVLSTNSTVTQLVGTVPEANTNVYARTVVDIYVVDQEGMTNGIAAAIPQLPQGFIQGSKYLGSYVVNSAADVTSKLNAFSFDITRLRIAPGTQLTVTANYIAPQVAGEAPTLDSITQTANGLSITWTGNASLQTASAVTGPWQDLQTDPNSYEIVPSDPAAFFRLQATGSASGGGAPPLTSPFSNAVTVR